MCNERDEYVINLTKEIEELENKIKLLEEDKDSKKSALLTLIALHIQKNEINDKEIEEKITNYIDEITRHGVIL